MGINLVNKTINTNQIVCDGTLEVTLALTASPDLVTNPTDIVLVLDRSGSMAGDALENLKIGADTFVDIIAESTGGAGSGQIGSGSRIGIVSFADIATRDTGLITSVSDLKTAINNLTANGSTNHAYAFTEAVNLLNSSTNGNAKVIVMFTDGETTAGPNPSPIAAAAKASGIIIYCVGLVGESGVNPATLDDWASDPSASHVLITPDASELEELFKTLAENISKTGATNIVINETLNSDFKILSIMMPERGTVTKVNDTTLRWNIPELGVTANESAVLRFTIQHTADTGGSKQVNESITYSDTEGNVVVFPDPSVTVDCGIIIYPEDCPDPINIEMDGCDDTVYYNLGDVNLESLGRILQLDLVLKNVCPQKRVALAVLLNEVDESGNEYKRGMKAFTIPAHEYANCRDIQIRCIRFVLPEDLNADGNTTAICSQRNLEAKVIAHYIDYDFNCCQDINTTN